VRGPGAGGAVLLASLAALTSPSIGRAQDPAVLYIGGATLAAVVPGFLFDLPQPDAGRAFMKASSGVFDAVDDRNQAIDVLIEYQPGYTWHRVKPLFGLAGNTDGSMYGWIAAAHDIHIGPWLVVNVNSGPALYVAGEEAKGLGSAGVLRSGVELGLRFDGDARLTASFHHMSHGKVLNPEVNPGAEVIAVNLTWPMN
jgi:hypothetical protein